jgi:hypothetical protein
MRNTSEREETGETEVTLALCIGFVNDEVMDDEITLKGDVENYDCLPQSC